MQDFLRSEARRLAALRNLAILDTPREEAFDDIAGLAAALFNAPIALVSLVEQDHQWFKSCVGLDVNHTSRDVSFCSHAIAQKDLNAVFVVSDAVKDPLFYNNPLVTGSPHIRFYAGAPLVTREGQPVGSLCVIDTKPRQPTEQQLDTLRVLARSVVAQMELRRAAAELELSEEQNRLIIDTSLHAVIIADEGLHVLKWNARAEAIFGRSFEEVHGHLLPELILPAAVDDNANRFAELLGGVRPAQSPRSNDLSFMRRNGNIFPAEVSVAALKTREGHTLSLFISDITERKLQESERHESEMRDVVIFAMARLAESRDPETGEHIERVQTYCKVLAEQLAVAGPYQSQADPEFVRLMYSTSPLHDIGKVGIPDSILLKPGRLCDREFAIMKTHAAIGAETLAAAMERFPDTRFLRMARNIAANHHEHFDGTGYPKGLNGDQIPLCGRIVALADVYDALTSRRVYKAAFTHDLARGIIVGESGKHFDPVIVDAFLATESQFRSIYEKCSEELEAAA